ncbi:MAG: hypothetical protein SFY32_04910, partial [Bacteroidota bacterium]|nr:hypothetical protein [Bacteroidota bacterium]
RKLNAEIDLEIAKKTVKSIDEEINRLHGIIKSFAPMEASIGAFEREISVASEVYLLVLNKLNAAQFASLYTGENVRQTEYALPAEKPESSKRMIIVVLTFAISLIIVIAWIIIAKMMDHSIYSKEQLAEILDTDSVIADFPLLNPGELDFKSLFFDSSANYIHQQFAESCRQSRQYILTHVPPHQSILFLSSEQNEGKSFSIISLAYSLTLIGKKVLILDANLKSNSITKLFNPSTFLNNDSNVSGEKFSNNTSSNNDNIAVIGNKLSSGTPKEVFLNNKSKLDFDNMKREFDYIFIEAANTKDYADAKELFDIADALVIIFKSGRPFMKHDIELLKHIATMPNLIKGYILNMVHVEIPNEGFWSNLFRKIFIRKSQKTVQPIYMKFS